MADLDAWLGKLPQRLPLTRARMLGERLRGMEAVSYNLRTRLKLVDMLDEALTALSTEIEAQLDLATLPLPRRVQNPLVATLGGLKLLANAYLDLASSMSRRWFKLGTGRQLKSALERGTRAAARRLELAHRAYTIGSTSTWKQIYTLHALAREHGVADAPANAPHLLNIEHTYAHALLLAAADPTCIVPGDLDRVRFYLQRHVQQTRMFQAGEQAEQLQREAHGLFVISNSGHPPVALTRYRRPLQPTQWLLDARQLLARLQSQIDGLRLGVMPARLGLPIAARQSRYVTMLEALHDHWAHPRSRAHGRTRFLPRTDLVVGFDAIRGFMGGFDFRHADDADRTVAGALSDRISEWGILDESPGGFGLRYLCGQAQYVRVGEIVAVRPRERAAILLCIVRRAVNRGASDFDLGLEVIAPSAIPTNIRLPDAFGIGKRDIPVLLLPKVPTLKGRPALVAGIGDAPPGTLITLVQHGQRLALKTGVPVERFQGLELLPLRRS
ncbi:hypothetical protein G3580_08725 [Nitrogeniibacter mangrovi]|uniref:Uncharacterized protein n=1 Tax=Nitrogeniibacter mangrovi TaxID=2016596 RepID=A0A6C1B252_9RHOO|nr:hypothetical protein [Nitrogeniibacter mangrovi]QID17721.1 hypothetical protein G3580_08725 [Nitrogeniibacter mangrovi]